MRNQTSLTSLKLVIGAVFKFRDPLELCTHWSTGVHIVNVDGTCKCGRTFLLMEKTQ
jgi:hypothetical protein